MFAGDAHSLISKEALKGHGSFDADDIARRAQDVDYKNGSQDPENAYMHAMRDGVSGESAEHAREQYDRFIESEIARCTPDGLARALHAAQDSAASGHKDFQPWYGGMPSRSHLKGDFFPNGAEWSDAVQKSREVIDRYETRCQCSVH